MISTQEIYDLTHYNKITVIYDKETLDIISIDMLDDVRNKPYLVITDGDESLKEILNENLVWISDDNKLIPISDSFGIFHNAKELIKQLRKKRTGDNIRDYINFLKI